MGGSPRSDDVKVVQQAAFVRHLATTGVLTVAINNANAECRLLPVMDRATIRAWREDDEAFDGECRDAEETATDLLEAEARRRATDGWDEKVYGRMKDGSTAEVGTIRKYDGILMIFLLKGLRPEKFSDKHTVDLTSGGKPLQLESARARLAEKLLTAIERRKLTAGARDAEIIASPETINVPAQPEPGTSE